MLAFACWQLLDLEAIPQIVMELRSWQLQASTEAKRLAAAILEVLAGVPLAKQVTIVSVQWLREARPRLEKKGWLARRIFERDSLWWYGNKTDCKQP